MTGQKSNMQAVASEKIQKIPAAVIPNRAVTIWLFSVAFMVFLMALIGAITRLTESGLSIVRWEPVTGIIPPLGEAQWSEAFVLYQQSPQYQKINAGMTLADFKYIYFWEWFHRLWGRLIGVAYVLPLLWFWGKGKIPAALKLPCLILLVLGFAQGGMGWYMVQSGLVDIPAVSHYRLAMHLCLAALLFILLVDAALKAGFPPTQEGINLMPLRRHLLAAFLLVIVTVLWGAFVAGLDAGMIYNSFPMMGKYPWPQEIFSLQPVWKNFFENHATVQFTHRVLALAALATILHLVWRARNFHLGQRLNGLFLSVAVAVVLQVGLGISTLLTQVNLHLAVAHQGGAFILLFLLVWLLHEIPGRGYYARAGR